MADYYEACRCPHCKHKLEDVRTDSKQCPHCHQDLDPQDVWKTRKYSGQVTLPPWIAAFGWPLVIIVVGVVVPAAIYALTGIIYINLAATVIGIGLVFFFFKLAVNDDD